jgi:glutaminyl-peptide cyclotransferase
MRLRMLPVLLVPLAVACNLLPQRAKTDFSGEQALAYAQDQVSFGPRVPGAPAHEKAGDWIIAQMRARADTVVVQSFTYKALDGRSIQMRNILARFRPNDKDRVLYVTHWDTRPTADEDPVIAKRQLSFDAANDGASGVGLFVALGDALKKKPPTVGVDLLFVDGEDWGDFNKAYSDTMTAPDVLIGSTYFAQHLPDPGYKPLYGVLFDMIGDANLDIKQEGNSLSAAPEIVQRVWQTAADLGYSKYFQAKQGDTMTDDHVPLIRQGGIRIIDVISWPFEGPPPGGNGIVNYHHTSMDTMDKISAKSLQIVGDVALTLVRQ